MTKLNISDKLKIGKQELLLGKKTVVKGCETEVDGLLLNDLSVEKADGTVISAIAYIDARIKELANKPDVGLSSRPIVVYYGGA